MFDFIPLEYYSAVYLNVCLFVVVLTMIQGLLLPLDDPRNKMFTNVLGYMLLVFSVFYMGLRPLSQKYFGDMVAYSKYFINYSEGGQVIAIKDVYFHYFMKFSSSFLTLHQFFLLCSFLYIMPMFVVSKKYFKEYWFYAFVVFVVSFQFWPYGTNGIRNGIASSLFLLGISFYGRKYLMILCFVVACLFHSSLLLPIVAFMACFIYNNPKFYLYGWLAAIPISIAFGGIFENILASTGLGDNRLESYLSGGVQSTGFRYDFLLYSSSAAFTGWYFIFKRGFNDKIYKHIFNAYLIINAFWILVIRANFSNRFAYLSWFMIGLVIIYPFLKTRFFDRQHLVIAWAVMAYFFFTYFMNFIYYSLINNLGIK